MGRVRWVSFGVVDLTCVLNEVAGRSVVVVSGELDLATLPAFRDHLLRAVQRSAGRVVWVDLDQVGSADDVTLGVLLAVAAQARRTNGDLRVVCSQPVLRTRLAELRLDRVLSVAQSLTAEDSGSPVLDR